MNEYSRSRGREHNPYGGISDPHSSILDEEMAEHMKDLNTITTSGTTTIGSLVASPVSSVTGMSFYDCALPEPENLVSDEEIFYLLS